VPEPVEHVRGHRLQTRERELHLGLDAGHAGDAASLRGRRQLLQEGRLADARLAAKDQHTALTGAYARDEPFQHVALGGTAEKARGGQVMLEHARRLSRAERPKANRPVRATARRAVTRRCYAASASSTRSQRGDLRPRMRAEAVRASTRSRSGE
jgi:hypothetical protein